MTMRPYRPQSMLLAAMTFALQNIALVDLPALPATEYVVPVKRKLNPDVITLAEQKRERRRQKRLAHWK